jgi:homocysteine S-methyltransferase
MVWHLARLRLFVSAPQTAEAIDVIAFETIPLLREVHAIRAAVAQIERETRRRWPFYISAVLPTSMPLETDASHADLVESLLATVPPRATPGLRYAEPLLLGLNCTSTDRLPDLVRLLAEAIKSRLPSRCPHLLLYPNNEYDKSSVADEDQWADKMVRLAEEVRATDAFGGLALGGCCGVTPTFIARLAAKLNEQSFAGKTQAGPLLER